MSFHPLHERIREIVGTAESRGSDHYYLVINQAAFPNILKRKNAIASLPHDGILVSAIAIDGASPLLVEIDSLGDENRTAQLVDWLCEQGQWANGLMLLRTPLSLTDMRDRLRLRTEAVLPDNFRVLLRYFDGRILPTLLSVLPAAQRKPFLGCAREWHYVDRNGDLQTVADVQFESDDAFEPPLKLDDKQQAALLHASEIDMVIDQLHRHMQFDEAPPGQYQRVAPLVDAARSYGIKDTPHIAMFCLIGLQEDVEFHKQPDWSPLLAKVKAEVLTFPQALDQMEEAA